MVSAAKLKRAQDRVVTARPFANKMMEVLGELAKRTDENFHHPLLDLRGDQRYLLVLITADKGLCGAFNTNLTKAAQSFHPRERRQAHRDHGHRSQRPRFFSQSTRSLLLASILDVTGKGRVDFSEALEIARSIIKVYTEDKEIDKVFLIYNEFKSVLSQRVVLEQLLPVSRAKEEEPEAKSQQPVNLVDYIYEQPPAEMFSTTLAATDRDADLSRVARVGRFRAWRAYDRDGFRVEECE